MISDVESVLLGLIKDGSNYGYAIEKAVTQANMREWTEVAFSSIYTILRRMKNSDLITSKREIVNGRSRNLYELTELGNKEFLEKMVHNLSNKEKVISSLDAVIPFVEYLRKDEVIKCLEEYQKSIDAKIERYKERMNQIQTRFVSKNPSMYYLLGLCSRHIEMLSCEKKWIKSYKSNLFKTLK
jgi:DNA-binding PadR family transcriptional regulator